MSDNLDDAKKQLAEAEKNQLNSAKELNKCIGKSLAFQGVVAVVGASLGGAPGKIAAGAIAGIVTSDKLCGSYQDELHKADKQLHDLHKKLDPIIDEGEFKKKTREEHMLFRKEYVDKLWKEEKEIKDRKKNHDAIESYIDTLRRKINPNDIVTAYHSYSPNFIDKTKKDFGIKLDSAIKQLTKKR